MISAYNNILKYTYSMLTAISCFQMF